MTVRGAAIAAGLAVGVWPDTNSLPQLEAEIFTSSITQSGKAAALSAHFLPLPPSPERDEQYERWMKAVSRCRKWAGKEDTGRERRHYKGIFEIFKNYYLFPFLQQKWHCVLVVELLQVLSLELHFILHLEHN